MTEFDKLKKAAELELDEIDIDALAKKALLMIADEVGGKIVEAGAVMTLATHIFMGLRHGMLESAEPEMRDGLSAAMSLKLAEHMMLDDFARFLRDV